MSGTLFNAAPFLIKGVILADHQNLHGASLQKTKCHLLQSLANFQLIYLPAKLVSSCQVPVFYHKSCYIWWGFFLENPALGVLWLYEHLIYTTFKNIIVLKSLKTWSLIKEEGKNPRSTFLTPFFVLWISEYPWMVITDAISYILMNTTQFSQQLLWWGAKAEVSLCYSGISLYLILGKMYNNNKSIQTQIQWCFGAEIFPRFSLDLLNSHTRPHRFRNL